MRAVLFFFCAVAGLAQQTLTVEDAVRQALASHPALAAAAGRIAAAAGIKDQAALRPNPRLSFQTENWRAYGSPGFHANEEADTFGFLSQPFETGGKRQRRMDLAAEGVRRAELERELVRKQIAARVRQAYWVAAGAQRVLDLWDQNARNFRQVIEYHELRVREGAMAEADLLKVRLEGERMAVAANSAALDAERARIELFRAMGASEFPAVQFATPLAMENAPPVAEAERALAERTELKLARQAVEQGRTNLRLQQANAKPDLDVLLGYKRTGGFHTALGGLQLTLPLVNRNQGNVAAAAAETRAFESDAAATAALIRAEVAAAQREVEMRRHQIVDLLQGSLEKAAESSRIAQAAYREGGADLLGLLDAERVRIDLEVLYVRTLTDYRLSLTALQKAMGTDE